MMKIKFNEQSAIENMIRVNYVDENNIMKTIFALAKYNHHAKGMTDKDNYDAILKYITKNCPNIIEEGIYQNINECIKSAKKKAFLEVDEVLITKSELDFIKSLGDIKEEKAVFVMLAVAKFFNIANADCRDAAYMTHSDICQMSRITIPANNRNVFMQFAYDKGVLHRHSYSGTTVKMLTFVSRDENDPVVLTLKEGDYLDLAYTYLAYLHPSQYRRCRLCKKWIKIMKDKETGKIKQCCKECTQNKDVDIEEDKITQKRIECIDCGEPVYVSMFNTKTCRCDKCQEIADRELNKISSRERMKIYRETH